MDWPKTELLWDHYRHSLRMRHGIIGGIRQSDLNGIRPRLGCVDLVQVQFSVNDRSPGRVSVDDYSCLCRLVVYRDLIAIRQAASLTSTQAKSSSEKNGARRPLAWETSKAI